MLVNLSNESPALTCHSSTSSSDNNLPGLITIQERLPTFAKAATATLPHTIVTTENEPLSFQLSIANQEANMEYPPISPQTTKVLLCTHPDINDTIHAIMFGLITTIHQCTLAASHETKEGRVQEAQL